LTQQIRDQLQATLGSAYTLERELGGGGMSRVFVAEETALRRKVVVKVLPPELTAGVNVERFNREILLAAKLQHPNIVQVLTAGETQGLPYYTMPLVEGESLRARLIRANALSITEAVSVLKDVARALAYAHERGIVHRDIKPDNVLITGGAATVTDFGIAKAISASRTQGSNETLTQIGTSIGTPTYMSPEQAAGDPDTDHRTDIYSFGCMAFELLAGQPPFNEKTPRKLLAAHMGEKPRQVTELRHDTPSSLAELVMRCLEKEADDRPQAASDLVRVLETVTSGGTSPAAPAVLLGGRGMFRKALAIYAGAFVAVAVLAKAAIVGIGLPDWVFPGSLIVMALGLPVILWTGYVHRVARHAMTATPTFTPGGSPSTTRGTIATMALNAAPKMSWYQTAKGGMYAMGAFVVLIAAFMIMRSFGIGPFASLIASGQLRAKDPVVMTDFTVTSGDTSLARVVSFAVRTALSQSNVITVMNQTAVGAALERMSRSPRERVDLALAQGVALREGLKAVVDGEVTTIGNGYVLTLRLLTTDSARVLASVQASGNGPQGLIEAADKVAKDLRAKAGESLRSVQQAVPLYRARTASLEALRRYSEGATANDVERDYIKAQRLLLEALAIDSTFAEAWRKLGTVRNNLLHPAAAVDSARIRAYSLRDRLPDGERASMEAEYYAGPGHDRAKAIAAYERAMQQSELRGNNLALQFESRREFVRAESLFRADIAKDSSFLLSHSNLTRDLEYQGKLAAADSVIAITLRRFPRSPVPRMNAIRLKYAHGDLDGFARAVDSARSATRGVDLSTLLQWSADVSLQRGQLDKWRQFRAQRVVNDSSLGRRPTAVGVAANMLGASVPVVGAQPAAIQALDQALAKAPLRSFADADRPDLTVASAYALAGRPDRARSVLAEFENTVRDTALKRELQPAIHTVRGHIALAERKPAEAITEYRRGDSAPDGPVHQCTPCLPLQLSRAFDAANQPDSVIVQLERYLSTPMSSKHQEGLDATVAPGAHERLGQLYEAKGQNDKAAEHYRRFIDLWKNADPELQPRVAAAKARLAKLAPVEGKKP
jgi:tetratricopeptide (TPR) repeat protein